MDPKDKEIADLKAARDKAESDAAAAKADLAKANKTIAEKDVVIEQKNKDIVGVRKKFSEMTEEERAKLTETERSLAAGAEELAKRQEAFEKEQKDFRDNQVNYHRTEAIKKLVGDNPDDIAKIELAYGRLKDSDSAQTPADISKFVTDAYNMLGEDRPAAVAAAGAGAGGGAPGAGKEEGYADTAEGKNMSKLLGLDAEVPANPANPDPAPSPAAKALDAMI